MNDTVQFDELQHLLAQRIGLRVPPDAHDRFVGLLHERAARHSFSNLEEYRTYLVGNESAEEWEEFARIFTSGETFFFRDHGQFDLLRLRLLPELIEQRRNVKTLRLWSAGCASGEEAYSLAMLVDMLLPECRDWNVLILGTDIDSKAIAKAQQGRYGQWSFRMVPTALQQRYFHRENNEWVLDEHIRRMVTFRVVNLLGEAFPDFGSELHDMDLILCRNVFIYFDPVAVSAVAAKFAATLVEGGYLMTAHTELIGHSVRKLESRLFAEGVVYRRRVPSTAEMTPSLSIATKRVGEGIQSHPHVAREIMAPPPDHSEVEDGIKGTYPAAPVKEGLITTARKFADQGKYELAEQMCHKALIADPLEASCYFLLSQLAQLKGDFSQAKDCLNKVIYLDHRCVAAHLELAALYERSGEMPRALALRRAALGIVRSMPEDGVIDQYETTAGVVKQWLTLFEHDSIEEHAKAST